VGGEFICGEIVSARDPLRALFLSLLGVWAGRGDGGPANEDDVVGDQARAAWEEA